MSVGMRVETSPESEEVEDEAEPTLESLYEKVSHTAIF